MVVVVVLVLIALFVSQFQHSDADGDFAPPYSSPIASQNRPLFADSAKDDLDFEECEPLTKTAFDEDDQQSPEGTAEPENKERRHRHAKAPLHMNASRAVCVFEGMGMRA